MKHSIFMLLFLLLASTINTNSQWVRVTNGFGSRPVLSLAVNGNNIFAGTYLFGNGGVLKSTNNGVSWTQTSLINRDVYSLTVKDNIIFAGTEGYGIYRSTNNGLTWAQTSFNNHVVSSIAVKGNNIFAGTYYYENGVILVSANNGKSWTQTSFNIGDVLSITTNDNFIFAGTNGYGIYRSSNNGTTWVQTSLGNSYSIYSLTANGSNIFAGCYGPSGESVYRSSNDGNTWVQTSLNNRRIYSLAAYGNNIFAGTDPNSCYVSTNNGINWIVRNDGFPDSGYATVRAFCILNNYIFSGTANSDFDGVYRRLLGELVGIQPITNEVPSEFSLSQNYPNPFNPNTTIRFNIKDSRLTTLKVFDILGREIETLINEQLNPGTYEVKWNAEIFSSGIYYYKLISGDPSSGSGQVFTDTKKMVLVK